MIQVKALLAVPFLLLAACGDSTGVLPAAVSAAGAASSPPLTVSSSALAASMKCEGNPATNAHSTVLLIPGTAESAEKEWSWNYVPAIKALGWPVCTVQLPNRGMTDIQESAEYIVAAVRELARLSGKKVQIIGHSQGGMISRWAFKYWPDIRPLVDDMVGLASSNHGTLDTKAACQPDCCPAFWQQDRDSRFIAKLNEGGETFPEIDYTVAYTRLDEVVIPNADATTGSSSLRPPAANISNIATQDICPNNKAEHLELGTFDPVGWAIALDALSNAGPAKAARLNPVPLCAAQFMPGVNPATAASDYAANTADIASTVGSAPRVPREPALKCYAGGPC